MFNLSGSELVFLLLLALIVLGPEKLPEAVRRFGKTYGEIKKMSTGFQTELRSALDEPMREMRETADALKKAVNLDELSEVVKPNTWASKVMNAEPDPVPAAKPEPAVEPAADVPVVAEAVETVDAETSADVSGAEPPMPVEFEPAATPPTVEGSSE